MFGAARRELSLDARPEQLLQFVGDEPCEPAQQRAEFRRITGGVQATRGRPSPQ